LVKPEEGRLRETLIHFVKMHIYFSLYLCLDENPPLVKMKLLM